MKYGRLRAIVAAVAAAAASGASAEGVVAPGSVVMSEDGLVAAPLTSTPGDGYRAVQAFIDADKGNCVACHHNADVEGTGQSGDVGPVLTLIGDKNAEAKLRAILVDAPAVFGEETAMPAYYVADDVGETILDAQEIEDIVAYLLELHRYLD
ncbi:MAG: sulfur oxidation c-type cytochrome SoxX [Paracoccaceae bacterium]